tara:strand:- start:626 stop:1417 length:792 start_codon:yes stop_codon:yes gene_type:complete
MTKLKIQNRRVAASPGLFCSKNKSIELLDAPLLKKANSNFGEFFPEEESLRKTIDPDTPFFYTIEHIGFENDKKTVFALERGIGKIVKKRKKYFLERENCFFQEGFALEVDKDGLFQFDNDTYLVIGSYAPSNHNEVYAIPHSIAYTSDYPFSPQILQLDDQSVLGRLDGDIQSIDQEELKQILGYQDPIHTLTNYDGPLVLNSKFLELVGKKSMILSDQVALKPQKIRPREKQAGSIIFNEKKNRFEGYDGNKWRPLQWGDE